MKTTANPSNENKGPEILTVTSIFEVFAITALVLRFWSVRIRQQSIYVHDILFIFGFIFATGLYVTLIYAVQSGGLGKHTSELMSDPSILITFAKILVAVQFLWPLSMTFIRLSMLFLYLHLFSSATTFRKACYFMMVISTLWCLADLLVVGLNNQPFEYNWDKTIDGKSADTNACYLSVHATNFAIDLLIAILPVPVLWKLQMPAAKKIFIIMMFAVGGLICSISVARIALYQLALGVDQTDFTYTGSTLYLFTGMEPLVSCTLACLPLLRPVGEKLIDSSLITWTKTLVYGTSKNSMGKSGYIKNNSTEDLNHGNQVSSRGFKNTRGIMDVENGVHVNVEFDQRSFELSQVNPHQSAIAKEWVTPA